MKPIRLALQSSAVAVCLMLASQANAGVVTFSNILGTWFNANPLANIDSNTGTSANAQVRWGGAANIANDSGYNFLASGTTSVTVPPPQGFTLGQFSHVNFPVGSSITGIDLEIDAHVAVADAILAAVRDGRTDVGLVAGPTPPIPAGVTAERLYREPFVAVVRAEDPLAQQLQIAMIDLKDRPLVLVPASSPTGATIHAACAAAGLTPSVRITFDSGEALRELVRAGVGITILPARYLRGPQDGLRAVRLVRPTPWREVFALRSSSEPSAAASSFLDLLRKQLRS